MKTLEDPSTKDVVAIKRSISKTLRSRVRERGVTVASIARDTGTSRTAIRRVLEEDNTSITLHTMVRTAVSVRYRVRLVLEPAIKKIERVAPPAEVEPLMRELGESSARQPR